MTICALPCAVSSASSWPSARVCWIASDAWHGKLKLSEVTLHDPHGVRERLMKNQHSGRGEILVGTHLGNLEVAGHWPSWANRCR